MSNMFQVLLLLLGSATKVYYIGHTYQPTLSQLYKNMHNVIMHISELEASVVCSLSK